MKFFNFRKNPVQENHKTSLAELALSLIDDAILILDRTGAIKFMSTGVRKFSTNIDGEVGVKFLDLFKLVDQNNAPIDETHDFILAIHKLNDFLIRDLYIMNEQGRIAVSIEMKKIDESHCGIIIRNISIESKREADQMEFISTASHEMRTPVASIEGYLGLALNPNTATIDERAKKYLESAHEMSVHLGRLFKDLLDTTKLSEQRLLPKLEPVELNEATGRFIENYQIQAAQKGIRLDLSGVNISNDNIGQLVFTLLDVDFWREIMNNLVENAIKYTEEGGYVGIKVYGDETRAILEVKDSGIGVPAADLNKIFQKFYRVDNSQTREIGGTGLGLFLVKQRAEAMGGTVWVQSELGEGSSFFVAIPRITETEFKRQKLAWENNSNVF